MTDQIFMALKNIAATYLPSPPHVGTGLHRAIDGRSSLK